MSEPNTRWRCVACDGGWLTRLAGRTGREPLEAEVEAGGEDGIDHEVIQVVLDVGGFSGETTSILDWTSVVRFDDGAGGAEACLDQIKASYDVATADDGSTLAESFAMPNGTKQCQ